MGSIKKLNQEVLGEEGWEMGKASGLSAAWIRITRADATAESTASVPCKMASKKY